MLTKHSPAFTQKAQPPFTQLLRSVPVKKKSFCALLHYATHTQGGMRNRAARVGSRGAGLQLQLVTCWATLMSCLQSSKPRFISKKKFKTEKRWRSSCCWRSCSRASRAAMLGWVWEPHGAPVGRWRSEIRRNEQRRTERTAAGQEGTTST